MLLKEGEKADCIIIILYGCCEVQASFEGNKFVIEHLFEGSIINYTNFFTEDKNFIQI